MKRRVININGRNISVIGRVGMFNIIADITDTDLKAGDKVKIDISPVMVSSSVKREYI